MSDSKKKQHPEDDVEMTRPDGNPAWVKRSRVKELEKRGFKMGYKPAKKKKA